MRHVRQILQRGKWRIKYERRTKDEFMGRFGGGWMWHVGVQVGTSSAIIFLLVAIIRIDWKHEPR